MDPISNNIFSYDFHRFVLQDSTAIPPTKEPIKKFEINMKKSEKGEKAKKDQQKKRENK